METILTSEIIKSLSEGDLPRFLSSVAIFVFIWIEVRGLKKEVAKLNSTIAKSFAEGEDRFSTIEHRLTLLESNQGGVS